MGNARNLAKLAVDSNGDVAAASLDNVVGLPDAIDVNASAPADSVAIDSSGKVGIGTSSPADKLDVRGGVTVGNSAITSPTVLKVANGNAAEIYGYIGTTLTNVSYCDSTQVIVGSQTAIPYIMRTNGTERVRIDPNGHLLVGTTTVAGTSSNGLAVVAGSFITAYAETSTTSGVTTTLFTFPVNAGTYFVSMTLSGTGDPTADNAVAIVCINGSNSTYTNIKTGSRIFITTSGLDLQGRQTLFTGANIRWTVTKLGG